MDSYKWMSDLPAPPTFLKNVHSRYKKGACKGACSCAIGGLPSIELFQCVPDPGEDQPSKAPVTFHTTLDDLKKTKIARPTCEYRTFVFKVTVYLCYT